MPGLTHRSLIFFLLSAALVANAEQIVIPIGQSEERATHELPQRGETKTVVTQRFGPALERSESIGSPPIIRWDYPTFSVYFEQDRVLHAVLKRNPNQG